MHPRLLVVGDAMLDLVVTARARLTPGSDTPGQIRERVAGGALTTARLTALAGLNTTFVGSVGRDGIGDRILAALTTDGVHTHVEYSPTQPTGRVLVIVDETGERTMVSDFGANTDLTTELLASAPVTTHVHVSGYLLIRPHTRDIVLDFMLHRAQNGASLSLGWIPSSIIPEESHTHLRRAQTASSVVFANEEEAVSAQALSLIAESTWIVTYGPRGASIWPHEPMLVTEHIHDLSGVDSTGAGDAFVAGFLSDSLLNHRSLSLRLDAATPDLATPDLATADLSTLEPALEAGHRAASQYLTSRVAQGDSTTNPRE